MSKIAYITRVEQFSAAHRLYTKALSEGDNKEMYGKCSWVHGHGHNYKVEVRVKGTVDPVSGMVMNIAQLKQSMQDVNEMLDHKFIDKDVPWFQDRVSTVENLCIFYWEQMEGTLPEGVSLNKVKIHETEQNVGCYKGGK